MIGAYLNRHATLVYPAYGPPARALGISALDDQAQAGAIMWVAGNSIMVAVGLWAAVAAMVAEERRQLAPGSRGPRRRSRRSEDRRHEAAVHALAHAAARGSRRYCA